MASVVLDASAILALLRNENGADVVAQYAGDALVSAVNYQEVVKELLRQGIALGTAIELLDALYLDLRPHGRPEAIASAALYPATSQHGSSLGDRSCMALAIEQALPVLTADKAWAKVQVPGLRIELLR